MCLLKFINEQNCLDWILVLFFILRTIWSNSIQSKRFVKNVDIFLEISFDFDYLTLFPRVYIKFQQLFEKMYKTNFAYAFPENFTSNISVSMFGENIKRISYKITIIYWNINFWHRVLMFWTRNVKKCVILYSKQ